MSEPRWLNDREMRAWFGYRRMRLLLDLQINRELMHESGLSEPDYDVLSNLSQTDGRRMRLSDLAAHMRWSKSRLSHHITRMQQRGLVTREDYAPDGRGAVVALTQNGLHAIESAAPGHVASVRRHFIDLLSPEQIAVLGDITQTVLTHLATIDQHGRATPDH